MRRKRVLVVDDSAVVRRVLTDVLAAEADIELLRPAPNGRIGLLRTKEEKPDLVILDVEMPEMDGIETVTNIRQAGLTMPVIMFSTLTESGASTTLEALSRGASDYVTKPSTRNGAGEIATQIRSQLLAKIRVLCGDPRGAAPRIAPTRRSPAASKSGPVECVVIGVSTGGPNALGVVLPRFPADFPVPILIVQHMPPMFTRLLAEKLDRSCPLVVREAEEGVEVVPGHVWLAPGNYHMLVRRSGGTTRLALNQNPPENSCRPAADALFRSAAEVFGGNLLSIVMTGMGQDGLRGCEAIRAAGGGVIAQDEESCVVWGMPRYVTESGLADAIVPLDRLAEETIQQLKARGRVVRR